MATAQNINFPASSALLSPQIAYKLAKRDEKIVSIYFSGSQNKSSRKKAMLTNHAPKMKPAPKAAPLKQALTFLAQLEAYMTSVLLTQVQLSETQGTLSEAQTGTQNNLVAIAQNQAAQAVKQYQAYDTALAAQQHESWWQKVLGYVVAALCCVVAAFTGGATAFLAAAILTTFTLTGGQTALDKALGGPKWLDDLGTALVGTVLTCGAAGLCNSLLSTASSAASDAADAAASSVEMAVLGGTEDAVADLVEAEAQDITEDELSGQALNAEKTEVKEAVKNAVAKLKSFAAENRSQFLHIGGQFFATLNPLGDLITMMLEKCGVNPEDAQIAGSIAGSLLSVGAFVGAEYALSKAATATEDAVQDSLLQKIEAKLGAKNLFYAQIALGLMTLSFQAAQSTFGIKAGQSLLTMASITEEIGNSQAELSFYNGIISAAQNQSNDQSFENLMNAYAEMSSNFDALIEPGQKAVEILG
jgi:hypothetical protein